MKVDNKVMFLKKLAIIFAIYLFIPFTAQVIAQEESSVGLVIELDGIANIVDRSLNIERPLVLESQFLLNEVVQIAEEGSISIGLPNGGIFIFTNGAIFEINEFEFDGPGGEGDKLIASIYQGDFIMETGTIGDDPDDVVLLHTPEADIEHQPK